MLGAGVFTAFTPAARAAGGWLLLALVLAAVVATCNAVSSADLAANYPQSGGTYVYAGLLLGPWPARLAGVAFVVGKTSSAAAAAGTLGAPLAHVGRRDTPWPADLAGGAIAALIAVLAGPAAAIALSACCVLVYYATANVAALRLPGDRRRWPRWTAWLGLALCCLLAVTLPPSQVMITAVVLVAGTVATALIRRLRRRLRRG
jgi:APA family basic amino acid/polyamine antiporter